MILWDFCAKFYQHFPTVLWGSVLEIFPTEVLPTENPGAENKQAKMALAGERATLSRYYNQLLLEASTPALFDFLTLYLPRIGLQLRSVIYPTTNEEAVLAFAHFDGELSELMNTVLSRYRKLDIDGLLRDFSHHHFDECRPQIQALLRAEEGTP